MANFSETVSPSSISDSQTGFNDLATITEREVTPERSSSPEPFEEGTGVDDFCHHLIAPTRRSTHPPVPIESNGRSPTASVPIGNPKVDFPARANTFGAPKHNRTGKYLRHRLFNATRSVDNDSKTKSPRRASTIDTKFSVSFEETAVWDQKAILSLDGGGIRGYSALLILRQLMEAIGEEERAYPSGPDVSDGPAASSYHPLLPARYATTDDETLPSGVSARYPMTASSPWLPCHYFDYIAGTSTGGLISIMLGRLRMNIDDCIEDYETLGEKVFGHSRWFHLRSPLFWARDKYNHRVLQDVVRKVVRERVPKVATFPGGQNFAFDENRCRTVVLSYQKQTHEGFQMPYLFRSYKNLHKSDSSKERSLDRNPALAHDIPIWKVARATSAAPTYFKPMKIDGLEYLDGGFGANNPCVEIYDEVRRMNNNTDKCAKVVLSIGTGQNNKMNRFGGSGIQRYLNYMNFARKWASESEKTHADMLKKLEYSQHKFLYVRLNVQSGLDVMKLDEWRARGRLRTATGKCISKLGLVKRSFKRTGQSSSLKTHNFEKDIAQEDVVECTDGPDGGVGLKILKWFKPRNKTLESIKLHTQNYLACPEAKNQIAHTAKILVEGRRLRAKRDPERWEKACYGAWYQCGMPNCPRGEKEYPTPDSFRKHLLDKHRADFSEVDHDKLEKAVHTFKIVVR